MNLTNYFNQQQFDQYVAYLKSTGLSKASLQRKLSSIATFQKFLVKKNIIPSTPKITPQINTSNIIIPSKNKIFNFFKSFSFKQIPQNSKFYKYLLISSLIIIVSGIGITLYRQAITKAKKNLAYTTSSNPVYANRFLSFQGRLTDSAGTPITSSTAIIFELYNTENVGTGTSLYTSAVGNSQIVVPDDNGIFSVTIGKTHGLEIPNSVFTENPSVYLQITAGGEVMDPRQPIATVAYAVNAESLQGLPPSASGYKNTVLVIDNDGNLNLGETSPTIKSTSGTLGIEGQSILLTASNGSGGDIEINPDASGIIKLTTEGNGSTAIGGFINATNANLSTGNLFNADINNTNRGYNFISFNNYDIGTTHSSTRFSVDAYGNTYVGGTLSTTNLVVGSTSLVTNLNADLLDGLHSTNFLQVGDSGTFIYTASNGISQIGNDFRLNLGSTNVWLAPQIFTNGIGVTGTAVFSNDINLSNNYITNGVQPGNSNFIGYQAGLDASNATNSNFFGYQAGLGASYSDYSNFFGYKAGLGASEAYDSNFFGGYAGQNAANASASNFFGYKAGLGASGAFESNFFGYNAGLGASGAFDSNFFGSSAGRYAINAFYSNFFGSSAGNRASEANNSNFFGFQAGMGATYASYSNFFGAYSGQNTTNAYNSNFFGLYAGNNATNADNSNFFGYQAGSGATMAANSIFIGTNAGLNDTVNTGSTATAIAIGRYAGTGGFKDSIAIGHGVINTAEQEANIGNVLYISGIYNSDTQSGIPVDYGRVGIGVTNPSSELQVSGIEATTLTLTDQITYYDEMSNGPRILFENPAGSQSLIYSHSNLSNPGGTLQLQTYNNLGNLNDGITIRSSGKVGVGTINPNYSLDVFGDGGFSTNLNVGGTLTLAQGANNGYVLTSDSNGNAYWATSGGVGTTYAAGSGLSLVSNIFSLNLGSTNVWLAPQIFTNGIGVSNTANLSGNLNVGGTASFNSLINLNNNYITNGVQPGNSNFLGYQAGLGASNATGSNFLGYQAGIGASRAYNSNFIGYQAGIGASAAFGSNFIGQNAGQYASNVTYSNFFGYQAGHSANNGTYSNFFGYQAGIGASSASHSNFLGQYAGQNAINANASNFFGLSAGVGASNAHGSNFIGEIAGIGASNAYYSNFFGQYAGQNAFNAQYSNFFGQYAGQNAFNASNSNFIGTSAGVGATNAANSTFIGYRAGYNDLVDSRTNSSAIAIGRYAGTGGYKNSIALGRGVINTAEQQTNIGNVLYLSGIYNSDTQSGAAVAGGKVGIGTTAPGYTLDVAGDGRFSTNLTIGGTFVSVGSTNLVTNLNADLLDGLHSSNFLQVGDSGTFIYTAGNGLTQVSNTFKLGGALTENTNLTIGNTSVLFINSTSGNIGIGTTDPTAKLTIASNPLSITGSDLINNGTFTGSAVGWTLTDGAAYDTNNVTVTSGGGLETSFNINNGKSYLLTFTLSNINNEGVYFYFSDADYNSDPITTNGTYSIVFNGNQDGVETLWFDTWYWNSGSTWTIDDVSIKEISQNVSLKIFDYDNSNLMSLGGPSYKINMGNNAGIGTDKATYSNFFGNNAGVGASGASNSNFFGNNAGVGASSATKSNFIGYYSGYNADNANNSNFFGANAGGSASNAHHSNFFGYSAGVSASNAYYSNFFGYSAGSAASNANSSNFFGSNAGTGANNAYSSNFFGSNAGLNSASSNPYNAYQSNFFGNSAGSNTTYSTPYNAHDSNFFGYQAGQNAFDAYYSNFFGYQAGLGGSGAYNSNFFGRYAGVGASSASNSNFFGYYAGRNAINAANSNFFGNSVGVGASNAYSSNFFGSSAGVGASAAYQSNFFGPSAGSNAINAANSNFFGYQAGIGASAAYQSNFFGLYAGIGASSAYNSNFFGRYSGQYATGANNSNFIGHYAGQAATNAFNSNFIGYDAGYNGVSASYSNFLGYRAGSGATNAANSIFIGSYAGFNDTVINTGGTDTSIAIGRYAGTGGFKNSIALGRGVINSAENQANFGNILYMTGLGATDTQSATPIAGGKVGIGITAPGYTLDVAGDGRFSTNLNIGGTLTLTQGAVNGYVLTSDASGNTYWGVGSTATGTTYTASTGVTLVGNDFRLNLGYTPTWTGLHTFSAGATISNLSIGGTFLSVGSTNLVTNLNANYLNGIASSQFLQIGSTGSFITTLNNGVGISISGTGVGRTIAVDYDNTKLALTGNKLTLNLGATNVWTAFTRFNSSINVGSSASFGGDINLNNNYITNGVQPGGSNFIGANAGYGSTSANNSNFFGFNSGRSTSANNSNFFGYETGNLATSAYNSNFFGSYTGYNATNASASNFLGEYAGVESTNASFSNFFGSYAGQYATGANNSNFLGPYSGEYASNAFHSNFFGYFSGSGATNAFYSNFIGEYAGNNASDAHLSNFIGSNAGQEAFNASNSNFLGYYAGAGATNAANAIFIGDHAGFNDAVYTAYSYDSAIAIGRYAGTGGFKNSIALGRGVINSAENQANFGNILYMTGLGATDTQSATPIAGGKVGIGITAPGYTLDVAGDVNITGSYRVNGTPISSGTTYTASTGITLVSNDIRLNLGSTNVWLAPQIFTNGIGVSGTTNLTNNLNVGGTAKFNSNINLNNNFITNGTQPGNSNFIGYQAGIGTTNSNDSNFLGYQAGSGANTAHDSNFFGNAAGASATNAYYSNFFGGTAGQGANSAFGSNFFGYAAGSSATNASYSNFFGNNAGINAVSASSSNFLGYQAGFRAVNASYSNFFGSSAGLGASNATNSNFIGYHAGYYGVGASYSNFFGYHAGSGATNAANSIFIGSYAGYNDTVNTGSTATSIAIGRYAGTGGFKNSIAIGRGVINTAEQQTNIGNVLYLSGIYNSDTQSGAAIAGGKVGIGTTNPTKTLDVAGDVKLTGQLFVGTGFTGSAGQVLTSTGVGLSWTNGGGGPTYTASTGITLVANDIQLNLGYTPTWTGLHTFNSGINVGGTASFSSLIDLNNNYLTNGTQPGDSNFVGYYAGLRATSASYSNFFGINAGVDAVNASSSNFFGYQAGLGASDATGSNFFGYTSGKLASGASQSNFFGYQAGLSASGAWNSNFFGQNAGAGATNAYHSNFFGYQAGRNATNAWNSNFFGQDAGFGASSVYHSNFFGNQAGQYATNAWNSNFFGQNAGLGATSASDANFFGLGAGQNATSAWNSNFFGHYAGRYAANADSSNFIGYQAGLGATSASYSNFFGYNSGQNSNNATYSSFIGYYAGRYAANASYSNFFGRNAGAGATNAANSIFIGSYAGLNDTVNTGSTATAIAIGNYAGTGGFKNSIAIGRGVINTAEQQANIGNVLYLSGIYNSDTQSGAAIAGGKVGIGTTAPGYTLDVAGDVKLTGQLFVGTGFTGSAGQVLTSTGVGLSWTTINGSSSATNGLQLISSSIGLGGTLTQNTSIGTSSFSLSFLPSTSAPVFKILNQNGTDNLEIRTDSTQLYNTFIGYGVGRTNTAGSWNTGVGYQALYSNNDGYRNSALGYSALRVNSTGSDNTAQGHNSLQVNTTGSQNSALGSGSLNTNTTGGYNSSFGYYSLYSNATGGWNTAIGRGAGRFISDGSTGNTSPDYSIYLGSETKSGDSNGNAQNEIVIGYNTTGLGSNSVVLGNSSITKTILRGNIGLGTTNPTYKLDIVGNGRFSTNLTIGGTLTLTQGFNDGYVLTSDASGNAYWSAPGTGSASATNGLKLITGAVGLGGTLTQNTSIGTSSFSLSFLGLGDSQSLYIDSTGKVGIGTTDITGKFTVSGSSGSGRSVSIDNREIKFRGDGVAHMSIFGPDTGKSYITFQNTSANSATGTAGTDLLTILSDGKVGIGTAAPSQRFQVTTSGANDVQYGIRLQNPNNSTSGASIGIAFANDTDGDLAKGGLVYTGRNGYGKGDFLFLQNTNDDLSVPTLNDAVMSITNGGYVGIGTTAPSQKLDVVGKIATYGIQTIYNASAVGFTGSLIIGNGGANFDMSTGNQAMSNTFVGLNVGTSNTTGGYNTAVGYHSLKVNTTGSYNTTQGLMSLYSNTTGSNNAAIGYASLFANTTGDYNFGVGYGSGRYLTTGSFVGNSSPDYSIYLGPNTRSGDLSGNAQNEIVIGAYTDGYGSNTVSIGSTANTKIVLQGNLGLGATAFDTTNPEKLLIDTGITTSVNALVAKGTINNYFQLNIRNLSAGTSASSDIVATADNGSETSNYIDMGINGSGFTTTSMVGSANDAYLYTTGNNLLIGNATASKDIAFFTNGSNAYTNERMRITSTGLIGIGNTAPTGTFQVNIGATQAFTIATNGRVGLGTTAPSRQFTVIGNGSVSGVALFQNTNTGKTMPTMIVQNGSSGTGFTGSYIDFVNGAGVRMGRIRNTNTTTLTYGTTVNADFAEYVHGDEPTEPTDLIAYHGDKFGKAVDGQMIAGTHTNFGTYLGNEAIADEQYSLPLAMVGIVDLKVSSVYGNIFAGDPIATSPFAGVGAKAIKSGRIVGHAIESYSNNNPNTIGSIKIIVQPTYYDSDINITSTGQIAVNYDIPESVLSSLGFTDFKNEIETTNYNLTDSTGNIVTKIDQFKELAAAKIKAGLITVKNIIADNIVTKNLITNKLKTDELISPLGNIDHLTTQDIQSTNIETENLVAQNIQTTQVTTDELIANNATISGTLYADNIISSQGSFGDIMTNKISSLRDEIQKIVAKNEATPSALLAESNNWYTDIASDSATINGNLSLSDNLIVGAQLLVNGNTQLGNTFINGIFNAGQIAIQDNYIETTNTALYLQPSNTGSVHIMGETLVIADNGEVKINGNLLVTGSFAARNITADEITTNKLTANNSTINDLSSTKINIATDSGSLVIASESDVNIATSSAKVNSNATAGTATLPAGKTELIISTDKITANSMVYLTPQSSTQNQVLYVKSKDTSSFTISLDNPLTQDIQINWWIIN